MINLFLVLAVAAAAPQEKKKLIGSELINASKPEDWRTPSPENLLYMEIPQGRVIIELSPEYTPKHTARIQDLAKQKYWDGLAVVRVQDGYVVQWADPNAEKPELKKKFKGSEVVLPHEMGIELKGTKIPFKALPDKDTYGVQTGFTNGMAAAKDKKHTWLVHCYGSVGVGRDNAPESGDGTELYAVIGHSPRHLDRNVAIVGKILQGAEFLSSLPRGHGNMGFYDKEKGEKPIPIKSIRLGTEVPEKERVNLEVLRTDTALFDQLIQAKRNRAEEWFVHKAGAIDVCNFPIPVREKKL